jgi:uncharacterized protein YpmB
MQNNSKLPVILGIAAVVVVLIVLIGEIVRRIQAAYIKASMSEEQKARPTGKKDIATAAREYSFTPEESRLLYEICQNYNVPNLHFFLQDYEQTTRLFKTAYQTFGGSDIQHAQALMLAIYGKICKSNAAYSIITTTMSLRAGQKMLYVDPDGKKYMTSVIDTNENEMIITTPKDKAGNDIMLQSLTKINLMIQGKNEVAFSCTVRVIRNQMTQDRPAVVVTHSNRFETFLKHEYVYVQAKTPCQVRAAVTNPDHRQGPDAVVYDAQGRTYNGIVLNYSGTSCNIVVKNSIRVHQLLMVETKLDGHSTDRMVVMVMNIVENNRQSENRMFLLHTNFVKLTERTKNHILSHVYSFSDSKEKK